MSNLYENIKEIDDKNKKIQESLEEIEILLDKKENKNYKLYFKIFLFISITIGSLYTGYYLAGLFLKKENPSKGSDVKQLQISNQKVTFKSEPVIEYTIIGLNKTELENKLKELLKDNTDNNINKNNIAIILCELGNYKEALNYAEKLIINEPNNPYYWNTFGIILTYLNLFDDAEKSFKKAISLKSDEGVFYYNLGNLYERGGKISLAKEYYLNYISKGDQYNTQNIKYIKQKIAREI